MADDNTIIEGTVKFRDGKKWKSRWCVMRRLSPVADCVHLQLYRDSKARWSGASSKASLSLQHYLGCESGFTLDKHSNTLALICKDFVTVLAFETRERLIQWQVKVCAQLGSARQYMVLVAAGNRGGGRGLHAGPARLLLLGQRAALTAGVPPRLLGLWEMPHLRRYGVVEGRFCFEGGSLCGKGEGLHVLITDQAKELAHDFDLASQGRLSPNKKPMNTKKNDETGSPTMQKSYRPNTRLSELNTIDHSLPPMDFRLYEDPYTGEEAAGISPYWPSTERIHCQDMGLGDTVSVNETIEGTDTAPWNGAGNVTLERCMSCMSKLGALSRSSTAALTPGAKHFNPAWTMEPLQESTFKNSYSSDMGLMNDNSEDFSQYSDRPPDRPPKPTNLELNLDMKQELPLSVQTCNCSRPRLENVAKLGPYENYDVPKLSSVEIEGEYYDTPKRLKECLDNELFQITKSSVSNAVILKKPCGCLLKFGKRRKHFTVIDTEETVRSSGCPCRRVTDWANNWIKLPYCKRNAASTDNLVLNKENLTPEDRARSALYATIDFSRKTKRKVLLDGVKGEEGAVDTDAREGNDYRTVEIDKGPLANYENLNFALSLEHYENAKDLLLSAGVTRVELDAIRNNLRLCGISSRTVPPAPFCSSCGGNVSHVSSRICRSQCSDDYLTMEPKSIEGNQLEMSRIPPAGYTPMSPLSGFTHHARSPLVGRLFDEKSASNPTLGAPEPELTEEKPRNRTEHRKRSSSADSSRFLEDGDDSEGGGSSAETLRGAVAGAVRTVDDCGCAPDKHSDADSSEASKGCIGAGVPGNRDSSSSNDSGVSSCSARRGACRPDFELPATTYAVRRHYRSARRAAGRRAPPPRRSRSSDLLGAERGEEGGAKFCSAEAEVPVLSSRQLRGVVDTHSTSSGTSDMSDYIETLSICSSHSSTDTPITMRVVRQTTSTLRPRSGNEYQNVDARLTGAAAPRVPRIPSARAPRPDRR